MSDQNGSKALTSGGGKYGYNLYRGIPARYSPLQAQASELPLKRESCIISQHNWVFLLLVSF